MITVKKISNVLLIHDHCHQIKALKEGNVCVLNLLYRSHSLRKKRVRFIEIGRKYTLSTNNNILDQKTINLNY